MRQKPCLTSSDVHKMAAACKAEAEKNKWSVTIAIVDDAGILLYLDRLDGASAPTAEVATAKAKTSAVTRRPSKFWEDRIKDRPAFLNFPGVLQIQGGLRVVVADMDVDHGGPGRLAGLCAGDQLVERHGEHWDVGLAGFRPCGGHGDQGCCCRHAGDPATPGLSWGAMPHMD